MTEFEIKDSGERKEFSSGMKRDVDAGKPRYDLIDRDGLYQLAMHMTHGAEKYGERNWQLADSEAEARRFQASGFRHYMQWLNGERDEDHASAVVFNIWASNLTFKTIESKTLKQGLKETLLKPQVAYQQATWERLTD